MLNSHSNSNNCIQKADGDNEPSGLINTESKPKLIKAISKISDLVVEGLKHGFYELIISIEITKENKRKFVVKAGKSYQFYIPEEGIIT